MIAAGNVIFWAVSWNTSRPFGISTKPKIVKKRPEHTGVCGDGSDPFGGLTNRGNSKTKNIRARSQTTSTLRRSSLRHANISEA